MELREELDKWVKDETKYLTKFYHIRNSADKKDVELFYKYEKEDELIEYKQQAEIGINYQLSQEQLDGFVNAADDKFHRFLAKHIEDKWEQDIFQENPTNKDIFEIAYYCLESKGKVIITRGLRKGEEIIPRDELVLDLVTKGKMEIVGWSHT